MIDAVSKAGTNDKKNLNVTIVMQSPSADHKPATEVKPADLSQAQKEEQQYEQDKKQAEQALKERVEMKKSKNSQEQIKKDEEKKQEIIKTMIELGKKEDKKEDEQAKAEEAKAGNYMKAIQATLKALEDQEAATKKALTQKAPQSKPTTVPAAKPSGKSNSQQAEELAAELIKDPMHALDMLKADSQTLQTEVDDPHSQNQTVA